MGEYIATFHTHLSALLSSRALTGAGREAQMAPVPRALSSSCGTCVHYWAASPRLELLDEDMEAVWAVEGGNYALLYENQ